MKNREMCIRDSPGILIGVIILQVINYSLYYLGVNAYLQYIIKGLIIILAVAIDAVSYTHLSFRNRMRALALRFICQPFPMKK